MVNESLNKTFLKYAEEKGYNTDEEKKSLANDLGIYSWFGG